MLLIKIDQPRKVGKKNWPTPEKSLVKTDQPRKLSQNTAVEEVEHSWSKTRMAVAIYNGMIAKLTIDMHVVKNITCLNLPVTIHDLH